MKTYKDLKEIKKAVIKSKKESTNSTINNIKNNFDEFKNCWWFRENTTANQKKKPTKELQALLIAKVKKEEKKYLTQVLKEIDDINAAEPVRYLSIVCEWHASRTWGKNPSVETRSGEYHTGSATGCGYDKLSAAVAHALNQDKRVLKRLYTQYEKELRKAKRRVSPHEALGYGSGYGARPYFEGGVGYSCHKSIFDKLNATINIWTSGANSDHMIIEWKR